jgi:hypothetical protein
MAQDYHALFHRSTIFDHLSLFRSLLDSRDLTADQAFALFHTIRLELETPQAHKSTAYVRYGQVMELLHRDMPDVYEQLVSTWKVKRGIVPAPQEIAESTSMEEDFWDEDQRPSENPARDIHQAAHASQSKVEPLVEVSEAGEGTEEHGEPEEAEDEHEEEEPEKQEQDEKAEEVDEEEIEGSADENKQEKKNDEEPEEKEAEGTADEEQEEKETEVGPEEAVTEKEESEAVEPEERESEAEEDKTESESVESNEEAQEESDHMISEAAAAAAESEHISMEIEPEEVETEGEEEPPLEAAE